MNNELNAIERGPDCVRVADVADAQLGVSRQIPGSALRVNLGIEIVENADGVSGVQEVVDDEGSYEAGAARYEYAVTHPGQY